MKLSEIVAPGATDIRRVMAVHGGHATLIRADDSTACREPGYREERRPRCAP